MIPFHAALDIVLSSKPLQSVERVPLTQALYRVLAEDVRSDIDMPPFRKSAVDGFACLRADLFPPAIERNTPTHPANTTIDTPTRSLTIIETIPAGKLPEKKVHPGECARVMTGAMVPEGADTMVMVEHTTLSPDNTIRYTPPLHPVTPTKERPNPSSNICARGEDILTGNRVLSAGTLIRPSCIAVLASVGAINPLVSRVPSVGILSTGDELVPPEEVPGIARIRDSNSYQLIAQLQEHGIRGENLGIVKDDKASLDKALRHALNQFDVLLLTGGVSMGDFDHVPEIMQQCGIEILFKSIAIQPGRPTLFGKAGSRYVFGLPGNPVSSFVQFNLLVKPFLFHQMGHPYHPHTTPLPLGVTITRKKSNRQTAIPVRVQHGEVFPVEYHGSAHIHAYADADGLIILDTGVTERKKGEPTEVTWI